MSWELWHQGWPVFIKTKGGPGSGHHGHKGVPGQRGGSAPGGMAGYLLAAPTEDVGVGRVVGVENWLEEHVAGTWEAASDFERVALKDRVARDLSAATGGVVTEQEAADFVRQWAHSSNDDDMRSLAIQTDAAGEFGVKTSKFTQDKIGPLKERAAQSLFKQEQEAEYFKFKQSGATASELSAMEKQQDAVWAKRYPGVDVGYVPTPGYGDYPKLMPLMESTKQRAVLRAMYGKTQAELKARGIKEVRLYRGLDSIETKTGYDKADWRRAEGESRPIKTNALESWSVSNDEATKFAGYGAERVGVVLETVIPAERVLSAPATGFGCLTEGEVVVIGGVAGDSALVSAVFMED